MLNNFFDDAISERICIVVLAIKLHELQSWIHQVPASTCYLTSVTRRRPAAGGLPSMTRPRPHLRRALDLPANKQQLAAGVHEVVQRHAEETSRPRWLAVDDAVGGERHGEEVLVVVDGVEPWRPTS
uniref:Uncharacterized protein n=1 Tax=Oryza meridionalis TaxID=40149 RepID=A0A0E0CRK8_9ORYZ